MKKYFKGDDNLGSEDKRDPMYVNLCNVFSPHGDTHMGERAYDVDFTEYGGNPMVESKDEYFYMDKDNIDEVYTLKKRRDSLH